MLKIVQVPNPVLTTSVKPVKTIDAKIKKLVKEMTETLEAQLDPQGVGLAATQVGVSLALFITKSSPKSPVQVYINPKILELKSLGKKSKKKKDQALEGCLSIPKIWSPLTRPQEVTIEYQTLDGKTTQETFKGFDAVIIQHEIDHLDGILFTQRCLEQKVPLYEEKDDEFKKVEF